MKNKNSTLRVLSIIVCVAVDVMLIHYLDGLVSSGMADAMERKFRSYFRDDAYLGLTDEELKLKFGDPIAGEAQDRESERGAIWWPSWVPGRGIVMQLAPGQTGRLRMFKEGERTVYVWQVQASNGVWRVVRDITPIASIVF